MTETAQKFTVSHFRESQFRQGELRDYFQDRDLGIAEATNGKVLAVVHRACGPCPQGGSGSHLHKLQFQMNYVLKGWMRVVIGGEGEFVFKAGDSWLQPPEIEHNVTEFSEDMEVLEITMPAEFETVGV